MNMEEWDVLARRLSEWRRGIRAATACVWPEQFTAVIAHELGRL